MSASTWRQTRLRAPPPEPLHGAPERALPDARQAKTIPEPQLAAQLSAIRLTLGRWQARHWLGVLPAILARILLDRHIA